MNLSGSGIGFSIGARGAHVGITARGQHYTSIGLPGTGVSWRQYERTPALRQVPRGRCEMCQPGHVHFSLGAVLLIAAAVAVIALALR